MHSIRLIPWGTNHVFFAPMRSRYWVYCKIDDVVCLYALDRRAQILPRTPPLHFENWNHLDLNTQSRYLWELFDRL